MVGVVGQWAVFRGHCFISVGMSRKRVLCVVQALYFKSALFSQRLLRSLSFLMFLHDEIAT